MALKIQVAVILPSAQGGGFSISKDLVFTPSTIIQPRLNATPVDSNIIGMVFSSFKDLIVQTASNTVTFGAVAFPYTGSKIINWVAIDDTNFYTSTGIVGNVYNNIDSGAIPLVNVEAAFAGSYDGTSVGFTPIANTGRYFIGQAVLDGIFLNYSVGSATSEAGELVEVLTPDTLLCYVYDDGDYPDGPLGPTVNDSPTADPTNLNPNPIVETGEFDPNQPLPLDSNEAGDTEFNPLLNGPAEYKHILRSSDITAVMNGFGWLMENNLPYYLNLDELSYTQEDLDMNGNRISGLKDAVAASDLITKAHAEALAAV